MKHGTGTTDPNTICLSSIGFDPGYAYVSEYSANMLGKVSASHGGLTDSFSREIYITARCASAALLHSTASRCQCHRAVAADATAADAATQRLRLPV